MNPRPPVSELVMISPDRAPELSHGSFVAVPLQPVKANVAAVVFVPVYSPVSFDALHFTEAPPTPWSVAAVPLPVNLSFAPAPASHSYLPFPSSTLAVQPVFS